MNPLGILTWILAYMDPLKDPRWLGGIVSQSQSDKVIVDLLYLIITE
jgi:hypothetical protein